MIASKNARKNKTSYNPEVLRRYMIYTLLCNYTHAHVSGTLMSRTRVPAIVMTGTRLFSTPSMPSICLSVCLIPVPRCLKLS